MNEIFSKLIVSRNDANQIEMELQLLDSPEKSGGKRERGTSKYNPKNDEDILNSITRIEFEHKMELPAPQAICSEGIWSSPRGLHISSPMRKAYPNWSLVRREQEKSFYGY